MKEAPLPLGLIVVAAFGITVMMVVRAVPPAPALSPLVPRCNADNDMEIYPDLTRCENYFRCENGFALLYECRYGLYFDRDENLCQWPANVTCTPLSPEPGFPPALSCPGNDDEQNPTLLAHPYECGKFFKCWDGVPTVMDCPDNQLWNQEALYCDFPDKVACDPYRPARKRQRVAAWR